MSTEEWKEQLQEYKEEAYKYFSKLGICPTGEEIVEYVCECIEEESGCAVDDVGFIGIAKRIGIILD